jgi:hypothetical protein
LTSQFAIAQRPSLQKKQSLLLIMALNYNFPHARNSGVATPIICSPSGGESPFEVHAILPIRLIDK